MDPSNPYAPPKATQLEAPYPPLAKPKVHGLLDKCAEFVTMVIVIGMVFSMVFTGFFRFIPNSGLRLIGGLTIYYETMSLLLFLLGGILGGCLSWRFGVKMQRHKPPEKKYSESP